MLRLKVYIDPGSKWSIPLMFSFDNERTQDCAKLLVSLIKRSQISLPIERFWQIFESQFFFRIATPFFRFESVQGLLYRWTEHLADFLFSNSNWGRKNVPQITPWGCIFWIIIFYNLKRSI